VFFQKLRRQIFPFIGERDRLLFSNRIAYPALLVENGQQVPIHTFPGTNDPRVLKRSKRQDSQCRFSEIAELLKSAGAIVTEPRRPDEILLANESSAINTVAEIVVAQINYPATHREDNYAKNLPELIEAGLIASELAGGMQNGYQFVTSGEGETFTVHADPILTGETGTRHFFADESGVIRWSMEGPATVFSPGFGE